MQGRRPRSRRLHPVRHLVAGDASRQIRVVGPGREMVGVVLAERVEQPALHRIGHAVGPGEIEHRIVAAAEERPLERGRHVARRPVLGSGDRPAGRIEHDDEAGQILVHRAEAVVDPRPQTRTARQDLAGVHLQHRGAVDRRVGGHRVDERHVVDALAEVREELADVLARLAVLAEGPLRPDDPALAAATAPAERAHGDRLAVELVKFRLILERVDLTRPAVHEQPDDALRFGGEVDRPDRERIRRRRGGCAREDAVLRHQVDERESAETAAGLPEEFTSRSAAEVSHGLLPLLATRSVSSARIWSST